MQNLLELGIPCLLLCSDWVSRSRLGHLLSTTKRSRVHTHVQVVEQNYFPHLGNLIPAVAGHHFGRQ
ncbi:hypothetical protein ACHAWC_001747 [Mediolabrus comicus]